MKQSIIAGVIAIASFAVFAQPAAAETRYEGDRRIEVVQTADLDLTREAGAAVLERRIRAAARRVCHRPTHMGELSYWRAYRTCRREALEQAIAQVDAPLVLARFEDVTRERRLTAA